MHAVATSCACTPAAAHVARDGDERGVVDACVSVKRYMCTWMCGWMCACAWGDGSRGRALAEARSPSPSRAPGCPMPPADAAPGRV